MKFITLLLSAAWATTAFAQTPHEQLIELSKAGNGVIKLNDSTWNLLTASRREWSAVVQLTALGKQLKCAPCREFDPHFNTVAKAWQKVPKSERDKFFFASLDFMDGQETFRKLNIMTAPVVNIFPATHGPNVLASGKTDPFQYDFSNFGTEAPELATQLSNFTPVKIPYKKPIDWTLIGTSIASLLFAAVAARLAAPIIFSRWVWAAGTISTILVMTGGFMFVRIRGMPYRTDVTMLHGYQTQVGAEIWTVAWTYAMLAGMYLTLILVIPNVRYPSKQRGLVYLLLAGQFLMFSQLLSFFKIKNGGYPFKLLSL